MICEDGKSYEREAWVAYVAGRNRVPSPLELLPPAEYLDYHLKEGIRCMDKDQVSWSTNA